jgi:hypothetical protein
MIPLSSDSELWHGPFRFAVDETGRKSEMNRIEASRFLKIILQSRRYRLAEDCGPVLLWRQVSFTVIH